MGHPIVFPTILAVWNGDAELHVLPVPVPRADRQFGNVSFFFFFYVVAWLSYVLLYVRGICRGDGDGKYVVNAAGDTIGLAERLHRRSYDAVSCRSLQAV